MAAGQFLSVACFEPRGKLAELPDDLVRGKIPRQIPLESLYHYRSPETWIRSRSNAVIQCRVARQEAA
jgi:hypothetical protein